MLPTQPFQAILQDQAAASVTDVAPLTLPTLSLPTAPAVEITLAATPPP